MSGYYLGQIHAFEGASELLKMAVLSKLGAAPQLFLTHERILAAPE